MILLDTHVLLWLDREDPALGASSREPIRTAWEKGSVAVCAISFWEVAMLAARGRIDLRQSPRVGEGIGCAPVLWRSPWMEP